MYDELLELAPSPVVRLNRAVAVRELSGPEAALAEIDSLANALDGYHLFHAARADMLRAVGRIEQARSEEQQAIALTDNVAERALLEKRLREM